MPELAEVAFACTLWNRGLKKVILAVEVRQSSRVFREINHVQLVESLLKTKLTSSATKGKQMLFRFSGGNWLGLHLGMTGSLAAEKSSYLAQKHDALIIRQAKQALVFRDPRQFGKIRLHQGKDIPSWWSELPIGMLDEKYEIKILKDAVIRHKKRPIKALLLDQRYFHGMGNWMADEVLWRAKIHPGLRCGKISAPKVKVLFKQILFVARGAMQSVGRHGGDPPKGWLFHVRWKDGGKCPQSGKDLRREKIGGRTSCWCPNMQNLN